MVMGTMGHGFLPEQHFRIMLYFTNIMRKLVPIQLPTSLSVIVPQANILKPASYLQQSGWSDDCGKISMNIHMHLFPRFPESQQWIQELWQPIVLNP